MVDSLLPEFFHVLFSLLAHVILISLVVAWTVSILHRMVRKDLKTYFFIIALLILFFLVIRMLKYGLTRDIEDLNRYLWYSYYVSLCLIPPTLLLTSLSIENKNGKSLNKWWYLIYVPALVLLVFIYTNDIHQWVFVLNFENGEFSYTHGFIFYIAIAWEILITFISILIMILKCRVSACKKRVWIPILTFLICVILSTICFITNISAFKIPELLCFTCIVTIESCIAIGLIPSNENYVDYFYSMSYPSMIADEKLNVIYASQPSFFIKKDQLEKAVSKPIMLDEYTRLSSDKIHGGYVFKCEDLTQIKKINLALQETNERLIEENDLIEVENEMKFKKAKIEEQKELYLKVEESVKEELEKLNNLLQEVERSPNDYEKKMKFACVLGAYIKRRSNFIMLNRNNDLLDVEELSFSIKESLNYLSFMGVECSLDFNINGKAKGEVLGKIYDFFEMVIAHEYDMSTATMVHVFKKDNEITILIESDMNSKRINEEIKEKFPTCLIINNEQEATYFTFKLPIGGTL